MANKSSGQDPQLPATSDARALTPRERVPLTKRWGWRVTIAGLEIGAIAFVSAVATQVLSAVVQASAPGWSWFLVGYYIAVPAGALALLVGLLAAIQKHLQISKEVEKRREDFMGSIQRSKVLAEALSHLLAACAEAERLLEQIAAAPPERPIIIDDIKKECKQLKTAIGAYLISLSEAIEAALDLDNEQVQPIGDQKRDINIHLLMRHPTPDYGTVEVVGRTEHRPPGEYLIRPSNPEKEVPYPPARKLLDGSMKKTSLETPNVQNEVWITTDASFKRYLLKHSDAEERYGSTLIIAVARETEKADDDKSETLWGPHGLWQISEDLGHPGVLCIESRTPYRLRACSTITMPILVSSARSMGVLYLDDLPRVFPRCCA